MEQGTRCPEHVRGSHQKGREREPCGLDPVLQETGMCVRKRAGFMRITNTNAEMLKERVHWPVCLWERQERGGKSPLCACVFVGGK